MGNHIQLSRLEICSAQFSVLKAGRCLEAEFERGEAGGVTSMLGSGGQPERSGERERDINFDKFPLLLHLLIVWRI